VPLNFILNPPFAKVRRVTALSVAHAVQTAVPWDTEDFDGDNMFSAAAQTRLTPKTPGWYLGTYGGGFLANGVGTRDYYPVKNGDITTVKSRAMQHHAGAGATVNLHGIPFIEYFNGTTDYAELYVWQGSGGSLGLGSGARERECTLSLMWFAT
jgi:hypothetical protein